MDDYNVITCPCCGQEFLPAEIFYPDDLIGKPKEIYKTSSGKIDFYTGEDQCYNELYICDNCRNLLHVHADVKYTVNVVKDDEEFDEEFVSKFNKPTKFSLKEDQLFSTETKDESEDR